MSLAVQRVVNGAGPRLWNTSSNIGFPRLEAEAIPLARSERGVCKARVRRCASGSLDPSHQCCGRWADPRVALDLSASASRQTTRDWTAGRGGIAIRCGPGCASTSAAIDPEVSPARALPISSWL